MTSRLPAGIRRNTRLRMDGLELLAKLPAEFAVAGFLDPQYRGVLDKLGYGNEGKKRGQQRAALQQMSDTDINQFIGGLDRVLTPSGHLFLWLDKFHLCEGSVKNWLDGTQFEIVDLAAWDKQRMGMGYRMRNQLEYLMVLQKPPKKAKGVWRIHNIPNLWSEKPPRGGHTHSKPVEFQKRLIEAVSNPGDFIVDPCAGSFSVLEAATETGRVFVGCDIAG